MPELTPGQWYALASSVIADVARCPCASVPQERYAVCPRCACLATIAEACRHWARETPPPTHRRTPGQAAYAAWWCTKYGMQQADPVSAYQLLPAVDRRAWAAAAQAVQALVQRELIAGSAQAREESDARRTHA